MLVVRVGGHGWSGCGQVWVGMAMIGWVWPGLGGYGVSGVANF